MDKVQPVAKRRNLTLRAVFGWMGKTVLYGSFLYGEYYALRAFFTVELCMGVGNCRWILTEWHPVAIGALFVFVYLPLSPVVSLLGAWPGYAIACILLWIGGHGGTRESAT